MADDEQPTTAEIALADLPGRIYLLHFTQPYKHARHYIGVTSLTVAARMARHRTGAGATLLRRLLRDGGDFVVADVWEADSMREAFAEERRLKRLGGGARSCSICAAARKAEGLEQGRKSRKRRPPP